MLLIDTDLANRDLAVLVALTVRARPQRTPERRAAASLYAALVTTKTAEAARRALPGFATKPTVTAALELLDQIEQEITW